MRTILIVLCCLLLAGCDSEPPAVGGSYTHQSTGEKIKVDMVGKPAELNQYIAQEQRRVTPFGETPNFELRNPTGQSDTGEVCVLYKVMKPPANLTQSTRYEYYIYSVKNFNRAFKKTE